jgi:hypothetical protein
LEGDVVGDDVALQVLEATAPGLGLGIEQKVVVAAEQVEVGENAALRVEEKRIAAPARLELKHMIGKHGVEPAGAVLAGGAKAAAGGEVEPGSALAEGLVSNVHCTVSS